MADSKKGVANQLRSDNVTAAEVPNASGVRDPKGAAPLTQLLATSLWKGLSFARQEAFGFADLPDVARIFVASLEELKRVRNGVQELLIETCRTNFSTRWQHADLREVVEIGRKELARCEVEWKLPPHVEDQTLSADLDANDLEETVLQLKLELKQRAGELAQQLIANLAAGNATMRVGTIEWPTAETCRFHFFRRVIVGTIRESVNETKVISSTRKGQRHGHARIKETTVVGERQEYEVQSLRHGQDLVAVNHYPIAEFPHTIPLSHRAVVELIPDWLKPFVEVVEGQRIRESLGKQLRGKGVREWSQKVETERVVYVGDPAIILGPFVLTGWGIDKELEMQ